jgi:uncharacterized protein (TIGR02757 family)
MKLQLLKKLLEDLYNKYQHKFSSKDPVWNLHRFQDERDIELIGFITSAYAYGSVDQINGFIDKFLKRISNKPYEFTINFQKRKDKKYLIDLYYRFNTENDLVNLISSLSENLKKHESLKKLFLKGYKKDSANIIETLTYFSSALNLAGKYKGDKYYHYLLSNPVHNSTCKRMNLFLRWMVRNDEIDLGLWKEIPPSKLIMPVDTHIARVSKQLKLVKRKSVDLQFAIELTNKLKQLDPYDPVKYDFSLCHIGIEKISLRVPSTRGEAIS